MSAAAVQAAGATAGGCGPSRATAALSGAPWRPQPSTLENTSSSSRSRSARWKFSAR
jgi:hypothetical protein